MKSTAVETYTNQYVPPRRLITRIADRLKHEGILSVFIVFALMSSMGFPGNILKLTGGTIGILSEYGSFICQILFMAAYGSVRISDINFIHVQKKYTCIYLMIFEFFAVSMFVTAFPKLQIITGIRFSVTVLFGVWVYEQYKAKETLRLIYIAQTLFTAITFLFSILFPALAYASEATAHEFVGLLNTKNTAGAELAFGIMLTSIYIIVKKESKEKIKIKHYLVLLLHLYLIFKCNALGCLFTAAVPCIYAVLFHARTNDSLRFPAGVFYIVLSVSFIVAALTIVPALEPVFVKLGKDVTISGRTPLWEVIVSHFWKMKPLTGYGYAMFWRDDAAVRILQSGFNEYSWLGNLTTGSHNVFIDMKLNVGLLGILSYCICILASNRNYRRIPSDQYLFYTAYLVLFCIHGFTERAFFVYDYHSLMLSVALAMGLDYERKEEIRERYWIYV